MNYLEYFLFAYRNDLILKEKWYYSFFTILAPSFIKNEYIRKTDVGFEVAVGNEWIILKGAISGKPILMLKDSITVTKDIISTVDKKIESTIGILLVNRILLERNFGTLIPYINGRVDAGKIEKIIAKAMVLDKTVTVQQNLSFVDSAAFIENLGMIFNISATAKNITAPKGIEKFKKELYSKYEKEHGKEWFKDKSLIVKFQNELREYDNEYMKDDPTNGKLVSGKIKNNARTKMYLAFGADPGFDEDSGGVYVNNSLIDEYPKDTKELAAMYNTSRFGSYMRGKETQKGGAAAKDILRATNSIKIKEGDCGSTVGLRITVSKDNVNSLLGRYELINKKPVEIKDISGYVGKIVEIRSPMYCKDRLCSTCVGSVMKDYKTGVSLLVTEVSNILLNTPMKAMHKTSIDTIYTTMGDLVK